MVICSSAADCPSGWTCDAVPQAISNIACGAPESVDGGPTASNCDPAPTQPTQKQCAPPYADLGSAGAFGETNSAGVGAAPAPESPTDMSTGTPKSTAGEASDGGGCAVGPGPARGSAMWLLGLVGLVGVTRRRTAA
jgi:MYXO-CTERM domain-containing protein